MSDKEWLDSLRADPERGQGNAALTEGTILRASLLEEAKRLDDITPIPSEAGLALVRAQVHQDRDGKTKGIKTRNRISAIIGLLGFLAAISQLIVPVSLQTTRGGDIIWSETPEKTAKEILSELQQIDVSASAKTCWILSSSGYQICLPFIGIFLGHLTIEVKPTETSERWLFTKHPEISPTANDKGEIEILIKSPKSP